MRRDISEFLAYAFVICTLIAVGFCVYMACAQSDNLINECDRKGGTYFPREGVCLPIQHIPMDGK